ncbi:biotin/lipoyl-binding protein [Halomonas halmophila]|uniref:Uncharacterized protein n=1 Tax=Halomonas halmophila TaxID=252 RepID=A0A4Y4EVR9_9GAMM|nr:biotin/lipoyl-binding protein [Halomonas halmophila]GED21233.1 hypothetical protein HHA01_02100 [Halomonas halmophila]
MIADSQEDTPLPPLREDLNISPGAPLLNGAPSWVIHDPVRHRFFQIGQRSVEMISHWSAGSVARLSEDLLRKRALRVGAEEIQAVLQFLRLNDLLAESGRGIARRFTERAEKQRSTLLQWALHRYIFFRIPLVRPNGFLHATWPVVRPLFTRGFVILTAFVLLLALYLASRQLSGVLAHVQAAFTPTGAVTYAVALVFVKILHELGHGYQAVGRGLRVPVMGVAFLVMFPLLYTDLTDAWRLRKRRDRLLVNAAGIMVELTIAVYATLFWCFLPDGPARSAAFAIATISWFFSLLVNLNPLMRFDGYYLLADALGVHNLQPRSFGMGKWALRECLFGLGDPAPERLSRRMRVFMVLYSYATWIYRFFLFIAIALIVYTFFFKALGIILFCAEIAFFIASPIWREFKVWKDMRHRIARSRRSWLSFGIVAFLLLLLCIPFSTRIQAPAILDEARQQAIYTAVEARLEAVHVSEGQRVEAGQLLFAFEDPELPLEIEQARQRIALSKAQLQAIAGDEVARSRRTVVERQLEQQRETLQALQDRRAEMQVRAPHAGVVRDMMPMLQTGAWFGRQEFLARVIAPGNPVVRGYIREADLRRLDRHAGGEFIADALTTPSLSLDTLSIADYSVQRLPDSYLITANGGAIPVQQASGEPSGQQERERPRPKGVWYPVEARISPQGENRVPPLETVEEGVVVLHSQPEALATRFFRRVAQVLIRETEF